MIELPWWLRVLRTVLWAGMSLTLGVGVECMIDGKRRLGALLLGMCFGFLTKAPWRKELE